MLKRLVERLDPQSTIVSVFSFLMILSLICSLSGQQGHAGATIADSAQQIEPLRTGQQAPSFVVRSADNEEFDFDPESLVRPVVIIAFRGGWCPYCNMHLSELRTFLELFAHRLGLQIGDPVGPHLAAGADETRQFVHREEYLRHR